MFDQFRQRSLELEHLDKGDYTAEEYEGCIVELQRVNRWLGDTSALRDSLLREIKQLNVPSLSVLDVGAGSGELLRIVAEEAPGAEAIPQPPTLEDAYLYWISGRKGEAK